ncbi:hypothetical protein DM02DRAFT_619311 [Periconia macrospinosa]|uniref:NADH-ubiquinone oxidoreductase 9.5 kDa subunit n=1 Tax=Periconia macrospinosa TaxID=97972 RepID=A0A2V1D5L2_9PLEO|nr:hypothetical protein DM02DRAFT_619311 [Periconia macrospinosa]
MSQPLFWSHPLKFMRWAAIHKPNYFYSVAIAGAGLGILITVPPLRTYLGYERAPKIPMTYPIPKGPRPRPSGFEDDE